MPTLLRTIPLQLEDCVCILSDQGIESAEELLDVGASVTARRKLAAETGISETDLLQLVGAADLVRAEGIGPKLAALLVRSGDIRCVQNLGTETIEVLHAAATTVNVEFGIMDRGPGRKVIERAVRAARQLRPCVSLSEDVVTSTQRDYEHLIQRMRNPPKTRFVYICLAVFALLPLAPVFVLYQKMPADLTSDGRLAQIVVEALESSIVTAFWSSIEVVFWITGAFVWSILSAGIVAFASAKLLAWLCNDILRPRVMRHHASRELYVRLNRFNPSEMRDRFLRVDAVFATLAWAGLVLCIAVILGHTWAAPFLQTHGPWIVALASFIVLLLLCVPVILKIVRLKQLEGPFDRRAIQANVGVLAVHCVGGLVIAFGLVGELVPRALHASESLVEAVVLTRHHDRLDELAEQVHATRTEFPEESAESEALQTLELLLRAPSDSQEADVPGGMFRFLHEDVAVFRLPQELYDGVRAYAMIVIAASATLLILFPLVILGRRKQVLLFLGLTGISYTVDYLLHRVAFQQTGLPVGMVVAVVMLIVFVPAFSALFASIEDAVDGESSSCRSCGAEVGAKDAYCRTCSSPLSG